MHFDKTYSSEIKGKDFFCSWSGGKDSTLSLDRVRKNGGQPKALFTMLAENGEHSRSHALPKSLLLKQADCLQLPAHFLSATWQDYEAQFIDQLKLFKKAGINYGVFGDIDIESHITWVRDVCAKAGIIAIHPLWQEDRQSLLNEFIDRGFQAKVIVVNEKFLDETFIGKNINHQTIREMHAAGIDASGEQGEYHTVVYDGPIFKQALTLKEKKKYHHQGYHFLPVDV